MQPMPVSTPAVPATNSVSYRRHDLDWLRIIAILTLVFYHTGMIYVSWGWHIKSSEHSQPMEEIMRWLHRWRMPLLFFIAGAGTFFALQKRTWGAYAKERFRRLFIPLVFGMFVIVPPQIYIEWLFRGRFAGTYAAFYPAVLRLEPYQEGGTGGAFSWHHLWFICYLFFFSVLSIPAFRWVRTPAGQRFTSRIGTWLSRRGGAFWLGIVPITVSQLLLKPFFPDETHGLTNDWAYFVKNLLLFWLGYLLVSRRDFWQILADQRRVFGLGTLLCTLFLYGSRWFLGEAKIDSTLWINTLYTLNSDCLVWTSVLMTVGYGYTYLNRNHRWLPHLNAAVYPVYILHQTVIVVLGYHVLTRAGLGVYDGFLTISLTTLVSCAAAYLLLIRPFWLMRLVFGVK